MDYRKEDFVLQLRRRPEVDGAEYDTGIYSTESGNGYSVYLKPGLCYEQEGQHYFVEQTKAEVLKTLKLVAPCHCRDCVAANLVEPWNAGESKSGTNPAKVPNSKKRRGRPRSDNPKNHLSLRITPERLDAMVALFGTPTKAVEFFAGACLTALPDFKLLADVRNERLEDIRFDIRLIAKI